MSELFIRCFLLTLTCLQQVAQEELSILGLGALLCRHQQGMVVIMVMVLMMVVITTTTVVMMMMTMI